MRRSKLDKAMKEWLEANPTYSPRAQSELEISKRRREAKSNFKHTRSGDTRSLAKSTRTIGQIKTVLSEESPLTAPDIVLAMKKKWRWIPTTNQVNNLLCKNKHDFQKVGKITIQKTTKNYQVILWANA